MLSTLTALAAFSSLAFAHFNLDYPAARGFDEDILGTFPCGGQDTVSSNRTLWPLTGGDIALTMGHVDANIEVLIGFGDNPGSAFNTIIKQTFLETGLGAFCMTGVTLPSGLNITEGTHATIQVITNGDPDGGLYNCADITFSAKAAGPGTGVCTNNTGVTASTTTIATNANVTEADGSTPTTTSSGAATTTSKAGTASGIKAGMGGLLVAAAVAFTFAL